MSKATYHVPQPGEKITFTADGGCLIKCTVARWDRKHGILTIQNGDKLHIKDRSSIKLVEAEKKPAPEKKVEEFKVGDRVVATEASGGNKEIVGIRGTVNDRKGSYWVGVIYDKKLSMGHSVGGTLPGHSWNTQMACLRHLTPEELAEEEKPVAKPAKEESHTEPGDGLHWVDSSASEPVAVAAAFTARLPTSFASEVERAQVIADAEAEEKKRSEKVINEMNRLADEIVALTNKRRDIIAANEDAEEDHQHRVDYLRSLRVRGE